MPTLDEIKNGNGKFVDENGREQIAVPLSSIFKMVGAVSKGKQQPAQPKVHQEPHVGKKKQPNRGIKLPK